MNAYRVFISYSHEDQDLALKIVEVIKNNGLTPMWDKDFSFGHGFPEQIKTFIAHAHVFLPVITKSSSERGWVHQEIGYAMALNVPVLPVTLGTLPGEMIRELHAIQLSENLKELKDQLSKEVFENLVNRYCDPSLSLFCCAELTEDRAIMMAKYANDLLNLGAYGYVRQKGALSSFHLPDKVITHPVWKQRYGKVNRSPFHCRCQREERIALERHARVVGCRLIIDPYLTYRRYGDAARIVRLETLVEFLESMTNDKVEVAINHKMHQEESLTLVGDGLQQKLFQHRWGKDIDRLSLHDMPPVCGAELSYLIRSSKNSSKNWDGKPKNREKRQSIPSKKLSLILKVNRRRRYDSCNASFKNRNLYCGNMDRRLK